MATHRFKIEGEQYEVQVGTRVGSSVRVTVNGKDYDVDVESTAPAVTAPPPRPAAAAPVLPATPPAVTPPTTPARPAPTGGSGQVIAPIPGVVLTVEVEAGQKVTAAMKVVVLEAMKMENEIFAGVDGVVTSVKVRPQQDVKQGDVLVEINPT